MGAIYRIAGLGRLPLHTPYPGIVAALAQIMSRLPRFVPLLVDYSGVGRAVYDMLVDAGLQPIGVTITGGTDGAITGGSDTNWLNANSVSVSKTTLVSKLVAIAHSGQLQVHERLPDWPALRREMETFRSEVTRSGRSLTYNAASGAHDDLLISAALAAWYLQGPGRPGEGIFEYYRQAAGAGGDERHCIAADIGQSIDPSGICYMIRVPIADASDAPAEGFRPASDDRPRHPAMPQPGSIEWLHQQQEQQQEA